MLDDGLLAKLSSAARDLAAPDVGRLRISANTSFFVLPLKLKRFLITFRASNIKSLSMTRTTYAMLPFCSTSVGVGVGKGSSLRSSSPAAGRVYVSPAIGFRVSSASNMPISLSKPAALGKPGVLGGFTVRDSL